MNSGADVYSIDEDGACFSHVLSLRFELYALDTAG